LAIHPGHFAGPSALVGGHTPPIGARIHIHNRGHHPLGYYFTGAGDCYDPRINNPYLCQPYAYCPCSE
jgi:hypothetical protein